MKATYPPVNADACSRASMRQLLCLEEFHPLLDLRNGFYRSPSGIVQRVDWQRGRKPTGSFRTSWAGLSMFANYMKVVRRDRGLALRGLYTDYLWARSALELNRLFESYGAQFEIEGLESLQPWLTQEQAPSVSSEVSSKVSSTVPPVVFAANHMSTLETQTLCGYITPYMPTTFVVKSALARGYFAPLICSRPFIALERRNPLDDLKQILNEGCAILRGANDEGQGRSIIIFPQGTRENACFTRSRFNSIAVRLAAEAGVSVVPVALSTNFWSSSRSRALQYIPLLQPEHPVRFAFGPPLKVEGRGKETQRQLVEFIADKMRQWNVPVRD